MIISFLVIKKSTLMVNMQELHKEVNTMKQTYKQFSEGNWLSTEQVETLCSTMSERMKKLLVATVDIPRYQSRTWDNYLLFVRGELINTLNWRGSDGIPKEQISKHDLKIKENLLPGGYDLMMYDQQLKQDFPPYQNDIMKISVDNVQRPWPKGVVKARLSHKIHFPGKQRIYESMPQEILWEVKKVGIDPGMSMWEGGVNSTRPTDLYGALSKTILDYVLDKWATPFIFDAGTWSDETRKLLQQKIPILNDYTKGLLSVSFTDNVLTYTIDE